MISHDRYLIEKVCNHLLVFKEQRIRRFEGRLNEYEAWQKEKMKKKASGSKKKDEVLRRDYRISYLISALSTLPKGSSEYEALEAEYESLVASKRAIQLY